MRGILWSPNHGSFFLGETFYGNSVPVSEYFSRMRGNSFAVAHETVVCIYSL